MYYAMDPQQEYVYQAWEIFRCCLLRTLMSYRGSAGPSGAEPLPDLATAPPEVSSDGRTWTFHLRRGLHYAPPLQRTEITAPDVVRALMRAGDKKTGGLGPSFYLGVIQGFAAYQNGKSPTISGLETPNNFTLRVREVHPDGSLPYLFAFPLSAPIPPLPGSPDARFGVATGHPFTGDPSTGYGHYLVASGPYMFAGSGALNFSAPARKQRPVSGFRAETDKRSGFIHLVRNPSWDRSTDPLRAALANQIRIDVGDPAKWFHRFEQGRLDMVLSESPPPSMLRRYEQSPTLRGRIQTTDGNGEIYAFLNVAQPPFDDEAIRWAFAQALDRAAIVRSVGPNFGEVPYTVADHLAPDPTEGGLLSTWNPFSPPNGHGNVRAARTTMGSSRYARNGRCVGPSCRHVVVLIDDGVARAALPVKRALHALGIRPTVHVVDDTSRCDDPSQHIAVCIGNGWFADFPNGANFLDFFFNSDGLASGVRDSSLLGASSAQLAGWGYSARSVPDVDAELNRCVATVGSNQPACWAQVDQLLMTRVVPAVPIVSFQPVRILGPRISRFSWDEAYVEPALDRIAVSGR